MVVVGGVVVGGVVVGGFVVVVGGVMVGGVVVVGGEEPSPATRKHTDQYEDGRDKRMTYARPEDQGRGKKS